MKKRILSILLMCCMVLTLLPTTVFAEGGAKAIQPGTDGIHGYNTESGYSYIYYGTWRGSPIKWRVLDDQTNTGESGLFLLSDALLGTGWHGDVYFDNSGNTSNAWQSSTAKTWCNNFYGSSFSNGEQGAVLATTKSDEALSTGGISFAASENILNGDKVFFLSAEEAENSAYGFTDDNARIANYGNSAGVWWLRSPYAIFTTYAGVVFGDGPVYAYVVSGVWAARPAFNLNLNSVLFASAAVGGKPDGGLTPISEYTGNEWKLTLKDSNRNFAVTETTVSGDPGDTVTLHYTGATAGINEYISVILADNSGAQYYGRVAQPTAENGTVEIKIPSDIAPGDYTLKVFNEQYNGDYNTDYASNFTDIALTVENQPDEQFTLTPGGTYYFDLSAMGIPGTVNDALPDSTLHYVPFTYVGTVNAYKLTTERATTEEYAQREKYPHSLFIADYNVTFNVDWNQLNEKQMIFGTPYTSYGVNYTMRAPSAGSQSNNGKDDSSTRGIPKSNEWDAILDKANQDWKDNISGYIKNWSGKYSFGQDNYAASYRAYRGYFSARFWGWSLASTRHPDLGFRPVLEVLNPDTLDSDGLKVVTLDLGGGKSIGAVKSYTFENVRRTHTIEVIFMKANGNPQTGVFVDVATGSYYEDAVDWAVENGITKGTDDTHFSPDGICTRAQAVTFLWRAAGSPEPETRTMPFTDVPAGSYYYDAVLWAVENGITEGTSDTTFSPNSTCTRAQIVAFLWRSEKSPAAGTANPFADVKSTAYYAGAVLWAVKEDITKGTTNTTFSPDADCTRAQIVTFLWRCKK